MCLTLGGVPSVREGARDGPVQGSTTIILALNVSLGYPGVSNNDLPQMSMASLRMNIKS